MDGAAAGSIPSSNATVITVDAHRPVISLSTLGKAPVLLRVLFRPVSMKGRHGPLDDLGGWGERGTRSYAWNVRGISPWVRVAPTRAPYSVRAGAALPVEYIEFFSVQ